MDVQLTAYMGEMPPRLPPADRFQAGVLGKVMEAGERIAAQQNAAQVNAAHLLWGLGKTGDADIRALLDKHDLSPERIEAEVKRASSGEEAMQVFVGKLGLSEAGACAFGIAVEEAERLGQEPVNFWHVLLGLLLCGELSILLTRLHEAQDGAREEVKSRLKKQQHPINLPSA